MECMQWLDLIRQRITANFMRAGLSESNRQALIEEEVKACQESTEAGLPFGQSTAKESDQNVPAEEENDLVMNPRTGERLSELRARASAEWL